MKPSDLRIKVVSNHEELFKANLIRSIVYMHEQNCPYDEEFDLNDFTCTHIIGLIGSEPVLTARIRYFGKFAKFERLAIRSQFRGQGFGHQLLGFMLNLIKEKGIAQCYLHAQKRLEGFYQGYGFKVIGEKFSFSDHEYIEMVCELNSHTVVWEIGENPHIANRPEGSWEDEGPIENSLIRDETNLFVLSGV